MSFTRARSGVKRIEMDFSAGNLQRVTWSDDQMIEGDQALGNAGSVSETPDDLMAWTRDMRYSTQKLLRLLQNNDLVLPWICIPSSV